MSECNCPIRPDDGRDATACNVESPDGNLCSKPKGHDGPHTACSVFEHPVEVWNP